MNRVRNQKPKKGSAALSPRTDLNLSAEDKRLHELTKAEARNPQRAPQATTEEKVGATNHNTQYWIPAVFLILFATAIGIFIWGAVERGDLTLLLRSVSISAPPPTPEVILLEAQQDKVLRVEIDGERKRIFVLLPDRTNWLLISEDDFTATNPALSPDAQWVAYLSTQNEPHLVIVPLELEGKITYSTADIRELGTQGATVCPWTPIAWAMDNEHLAFFVCTAEEPFKSQAVVAQLNLTNPSMPTLSPKVVANTIVISTEPRQLLWIGLDQILVSFPATEASQVETVKSYPVP